jgi:hypothetical protein
LYQLLHFDLGHGLGCGVTTSQVGRMLHGDTLGRREGEPSSGQGGGAHACTLGRTHALGGRRPRGRGGPTCKAKTGAAGPLAGPSLAKRVLS